MGIFWVFLTVTLGISGISISGNIRSFSEGISTVSLENILDNLDGVSGEYLGFSEGIFG